MGQDRSLEGRMAGWVTVGGLPAILIAIASCLGGDLGVGKGPLCTLALGAWLMAARAAFRQAKAPLQSLAAVVAGLRDGDFSVAPSGLARRALDAREADALVRAAVLR